MALCSRLLAKILRYFHNSPPSKINFTLYYAKQRCVKTKGGFDAVTKKRPQKNACDHFS